MLKKNILLTAVLALLLIVASYISLHVIGGYLMPTIIATVGVVLICSLIVIGVKKNNDGYASFGVLIKHFAITISVAVLINTLFDIVQLSMMDDSQKYTLIDKRIEKTIERHKNNDMDQKELAIIDNTIEDRVGENYEPSFQALNAIPGFLFLFLISFIPAVLFKKNPPDL